jgi:ribosomal protein S24E
LKLNIKEEKSNPLLKRIELRLDIDYEGGATPSKAEIQEEIAKLKGAGPEKVEVINIFSDTGNTKGNSFVYLWEEKTVDILKKKEAPKEEAPAEKPAEEPPEEEPPKEEKKEEPKEAPKEEKA